MLLLFTLNVQMKKLRPREVKDFEKDTEIVNWSQPELSGSITALAGSAVWPGLGNPGRTPNSVAWAETKGWG